ncbi:MAG TPA: outer membrane beta-barrel protein [Candidatus Limnocylindrales bacterium]|nr:outer membrane beta-barrel protein [Candidatus Limnocylindrales bacterium]
MKKALWLVLLLSMLPIAARAQEAPAADVSVGYSYFRLGGSGGTNQNGASGSFAYNASDWLGIVGDFGGYHSSPSGVDLNTLTYMFGPRLSYRSSESYTPFGQVLLGGAHVTGSYGGASASTNSFAVSLGGGVDVHLSGPLALRPQVDYVLLRSNGSNANCVRLSAAIVFRFGQRR